MALAPTWMVLVARPYGVVDRRAGVPSLGWATRQPPDHLEASESVRRSDLDS